MAETSDPSSPQPLPPLRPGLEAIQIKQENSPMVLLKDQEGVNDKAVVLSLPAFVIAALMDGKRTAAEVGREFTKTTGAILKQEEIDQLVKQLDDGFFLLTERYAERRKEVMKEFAVSSARKAHHGGAGYPENPVELAGFLGKFFSDPKGPAKQTMGAPSQEKPPRAMICPHIDFFRGGPAYAWAFQALSDYPPPDVIVGLGVAHVSPPSPWVLAKKDYETPYGPLPLNEELYKNFDSLLWYDGRADEWVHRTEHSLEFPALWLKYLWREKTPSWIPILCSSFEGFATDQPPSQAASVNEALENIGAYLASLEASGKTVMIVAGVDLAHVGPRFGDEVKLDKALEDKVEKEDRASLEKFLSGDPDEFYLSVMKDGHWKKWCGLSALYTAARLIKAMDKGKKPPGSLLTYGQAPDPMGGIVSFFSALFARP